MGIKKTSSKIAFSLPLGICLGIVISILVALIGTAGITYLVIGEKITEGNLGYYLLATLFLSAIAGAWTAANQTKRLRLQVCLLEGAGYFLSLLAVTALFFGGQYHGVLASGLTILVGCLLTAILPSFKSGKIKLKNRAYR